MALTEYRRKRDFRRTPEPAGAVVREATARPLSFVIQKHAARRLHYDFRLELDGVLKSWAVPKGPSLDPGEKRLAVHVEDHPIEYGGFEGVIPEGEYGGGSVLLWDRGTWTPIDPDPQAAYAKGNLKFTLDGEKLHGKWVLVRMGGKAAAERRENWLLIKERDEAAAPQSGDAVVADNPLSVATGRGLDEIAADRDRVWGPNGEQPAAANEAREHSDPARVPGARKARIPTRPKPQLATPADAAPDGPQWLHEIKHDGYRLIARIAIGEARLLTRNGLDWTGKFPVLAAAFGALPVEAALIDGELVHLETDGTSDFGRLQDAIANGRTDELVFYAFDLLHLDGYDLTGAALEDRKAALAEVVPTHSAGILRYSDHQAGRGPEFFRQACGYELEGIVSKRRDRPYQPGRNDGWLKVKCANRDEFVVIGFTDPAGHRRGLGALLLGYYDGQAALHYAGRVGTGFDDAQLAALRARLDPLQRAAAPVAALPKGTSLKGVHWTEPALVAEVRYAGWTADQVLRHATFIGLREDKAPAEVVRDADASAAPVAPAKPPAPRIARDGSTEFAGVRLTHADRVLYPGEGITKLDLARYYAEICDWALPYLGHRPLSLVRCPNGQGGEQFFQKHAGASVPEAVRRIEIDGETHLAVENLAGLVALVQIGVLEIHPWGSTAAKLETPDLVTFDLDPDVGLPWSQVTAAALEIREALAGFGLRSFAKTTGGKGLHVVVPLTPKLDWEAIKAFAKAVAEEIAAGNPQRYTTNQSKRARQGRIYIDYLRNGRGATAIGAYSTRARPSAPVATPVSWEEVEAGVRPDGFTVVTVPSRLAALKSDPWAEIGKVRQTVTAAMRRKLGL
ncbi:MAG TPA: DNA ligase D [Stellaceae bacterium]|jgi:bifunctional non-homologous end joining protein LigD